MSFRRAKLKQRNLRRQMQKMGMKTETIDGVIEVIIRKPDEEIVIPSPQVQLTKLGEQDVYSIIGKGEIREPKSEAEEKAEPEVKINEADVQLVSQQAGVTPKEARQALIDTGGDLARAILLLKSQ
ncbi:MAG: nascent polypeptide-associated complex protein [Candidatus Ranarchaeia archaeon]